MKIPQLTSITTKNFIKNKVVKKLERFKPNDSIEQTFNIKQRKESFTRVIKKIGKQIKNELWDVLDGML